MGTYTSNQQLYLIDPSELVSVENNLNYNLRRADERIRPLVEYQITDEASISASSLPKDTGFKWYKTYTGGIWNYRDGGIFQDPNAQIDTWSTSSITFEAGYGSSDLDVNRIAYSTSANGNFIRWRGRLVLNSGTSELPANTTTDFMTPPVGVLPLTSKYFTVYGGNSTGDFQCFRIFIPSSGSADKRMEFVKYGGNASSSGERYLSLTDVMYSLDNTDLTP